MTYAFCHRDWRDPDYIHVAVFKDRVEIRNPGLLLDGLTIDDIRQGNVSRRRNPLIADLLRRIQLIEAWGRGMPLMLQNAPTVGFKQIAGLFVAVFGRPSFGVETAASDTVEKTVTKTVTKTVDKRDPALVLTEREQALCALVRDQSGITQKDMAAQLGLTVRGVRYLTDKLQAQGVLQRVGGPKVGRWAVLVVVDSAEAGGLGYEF